MFKRRWFVNQGEEGQAMAELAITIPVLLLILCAVIDFGWLFSNQLTLSYCSREGARYGIVHAAEADVEQKITDRVRQIAPEYIRDKITVNIDFSNTDSCRMGDLTVSVTAGIAALTPVAGVFSQGQSVDLSSQCVMKVE